MILLWNFAEAPAIFLYESSKKTNLNWEKPKLSCFHVPALSNGSTNFLPMSLKPHKIRPTMVVILSAMEPTAAFQKSRSIIEGQF